MTIFGIISLTKTQTKFNRVDYNLYKSVLIYYK